MSEVMENVSGKAFDTSKKLDEISGCLEKYRSVIQRRENGYLDVLHDMSKKIVSVLTGAMKVVDSKLSYGLVRLLIALEIVYGFLMEIGRTPASL